MAYSELLDGAFCITSALFCASPATKGQFVTKSFQAWNKKSEKCKEHEHSVYQQEAMEQANNFVHSVEHPEATVVTRVDAK